ncbi:hypothetical protein DNH61_19780 [Paenibacillus sambharensis]|uniref:Uncharacterized protein n=1 Tax=Paenibacillus sambharensis TaxID=1803190 RepID=A0A2W1LGP0_9BACL|nr:hypothetical protein [Paenibacillus sambharensis]PZD94185.1 hypothetical protein DNH61_19780 [Paenibacillus sambharensis]
MVSLVSAVLLLLLMSGLAVMDAFIYKMPLMEAVEMLWVDNLLKGEALLLLYIPAVLACAAVIDFRRWRARKEGK